jgi:hypothetical protein
VKLATGDTGTVVVVVAGAVVVVVAGTVVVVVVTVELAAAAGTAIHAIKKNPTQIIKKVRGLKNPSE